MIYYESDIYSLSVCIIEILVGNLWYNGNTYQECRNEVLNAVNNINENTYKTILLKGINENYKNRCTLNELKDKFK